jgi:hypothetical protein
VYGPFDAEQETSVNLFPTRASALGGGLVACVLIAATLSGCGAGQQSQTATQEPAVNGASGAIGKIALRNVRIRAEVKSAALPPGESAELLFVAANLSETDSDKLLSITSDIGSVTLNPANPEIPAGRSLIVGKPEGVDAAALPAVSNAVNATATVKLSKPLYNAITYDFVFKFERGGQGTIAVPVTAGDTAPRAEQPSSAGEGH